MPTKRKKVPLRIKIAVDTYHAFHLACIRNNQKMELQMQRWINDYIAVNHIPPSTIPRNYLLKIDETCPLDQIQNWANNPFNGANVNPYDETVFIDLDKLNAKIKDLRET